MQLLLLLLLLILSANCQVLPINLGATGVTFLSSTRTAANQVVTTLSASASSTLGAALAKVTAAANQLVTLSTATTSNEAVSASGVSSTASVASTASGSTSQTTLNAALTSLSTIFAAAGAGGDTASSSSASVAYSSATTSAAAATTTAAASTTVAAAAGTTTAAASTTRAVTSTSAASVAHTTSTRASTTGAKRASTSGGVLHKPQKCSPYIICTLQGQGQSQPNPVYFGFWGQSTAGVTSLEVAKVDVNQASSRKATQFASLPNQQLNGLECDFFQTNYLWDMVGGFCSGYTSSLFPVFGESQFISDAVYCVPQSQPLATSQLPIQIVYSFMEDNVWKIVRVQNYTRTSDYREVPIVTMPVGSGEEVELTRYRVHVLAQAYINLICTLTYTSGLEFITNYTTSANNIWDSVGVRCVRDGLDTTTDDIVYLQLVDAGNRFNLTVTSVAHTATSGGVRGQPVVVSSLQKNFGNPEETVFFGHQLQTRAVGAICSQNGRFIQTCNDCVL